MELASGVMTRAGVTAREDMPAEQAAQTLVAGGYTALPVVDGYDHEILVGIVTRRDLLRRPARRAHGVR